MGRGVGGGMGGMGGGGGGGEGLEARGEELSQKRRGGGASSREHRQQEEGEATPGRGAGFGVGLELGLTGDLGAPSLESRCGQGRATLGEGWCVGVEVGVGWGGRGRTA